MPTPLKFGYKFSFFVFIFTFVVILAGGVVRTTQSGMGCPDWPTCFGQWIPPTSASELPPNFESYLKKQDIDHTFNVYHTWIEAINRYIAALLGVFAAAQLIYYITQRRQSTYGRKALWYAIAYFILIIIIGLVGAVVVTLNLAHLSISLHLILALLLVMVQLKLLLHLRPKAIAYITKPQVTWLVVASVLISIQYILGTVVRMYIDDVSKALNYTQRDAWLRDEPTTFLIHRSFSWLVMGILLYLPVLLYNNKVAKPRAITLCILGLSNAIVGIVLYYAHMPAAAQPVHLLLATLLVTQLVYIWCTSVKV